MHDSANPQSGLTLAAHIRQTVIDDLSQGALAPGMAMVAAKVDDLAPEHKGLAWIYMQGWTVLYGVVALEVFGHMDPRVIESGEMYVEAIRGFAPKIGLEAESDRLVAMIRERFVR